MGFLNGKTAIITGGGRSVLKDGRCGSIGYGIATAYAKEGANLVVTGRNVQKIEDAKEELERLYGIRVLAIPADISSGADNEAIAQSVIDKAVKDAEAHAEEDKKRKEEIEVRNNAESLVYNSEKTLTELGDKISGEEKAKVETEIDNVKKALEGSDVENIKQATEKLTTVFYEISEKLYAAKNPQAGAEQANANPNATDAQANNGNVYDADYKVEEDGEDKK